MEHRSNRLAALVALVTVGAGACSDLSTPADLDREQILGVRATPATLVPGESVVLDTLIAGPDGQLNVETTWSIYGEATELRLEDAGPGGAVLFHEGRRAQEATVDLNLVVVLTDGSELLARKSIAVEAMPAANPEIETLVVDGAALGEAAMASVARGLVSLEVNSAAGTSVAWYTSIGEIRYYRDQATSLEISDEDGEAGWLAVVVRDGIGGTTWRSVGIAVE